MCGIYGVLSLVPGNRPDLAWLTPMGNAIIHRGPDDSGTYCDGQIAMGMRRLSIIDVEGGHQPLSSADGSIQVICNGEIYNFRVLREELQKDGFQFQTNSDSEVLVHLYAKFGKELIHHLDGMFAFAIWDARLKRLVLGRDRVGIKPLYYRNDGRWLVFASEVKALLAGPGMSTEIDTAALDELLALGYTVAPRSLFKGVYQLTTGSMLSTEESSLSVERYWQYSARDDGIIADAEACRSRLRTDIERSVVAQMVADVPLGAFLSGGVDSSAIVAFMSRNSMERVKTYSIGFDLGSAGRFYNELPYARQVAHHFGTDHHEILVRPDVAELLPRLIWHMDEPMADSALITTFLVAEFARKDVKVILSGAGGDELFGGYRRYLGPHYSHWFVRIPRILRSGLLLPLARVLPSDRAGAIRNFLRYVRQFLLTAELSPELQYESYLAMFSGPEIERLLRERPRQKPSAVRDAISRLQTNDSINGFMQVDFDTQLPNDILMLTDKMTMAASVECRVPLLSNELIDLSEAIPGQMKIEGSKLKSILKQSVAGLVPDTVLRRAKWGFGAPMGAWLRKELRPLVDATLSYPVVEKRGLFNPQVINSLIALHDAGREDYTNHLQTLVNLEIWCRLFLDGNSIADVGSELIDRKVFAGLG